MNPHVNKFINNDGFGYFRLHKYLYGLEEAPYNFNKFLDTKPKDLGFEKSRAAPCLYTRVVDEAKNKRMYVATLVDDILVISPSVKEGERLEKEQGNISN
jgi:hypothetical protein